MQVTILCGYKDSNLAHQGDGSEVIANGQVTGGNTAAMGELFVVNENVAKALETGRPVVALETTVLTHGLPSNINLETFLEMVNTIKNANAVPAAIGVLDGKIWVGPTEDALKRLAQNETTKVSLADLPAALAQKKLGGTTVAATLWAASQAGIRVFATGGIGGVHRGWQSTLDVSADISALARFGGCVVCSGAKAVLDLRCTLELLETTGVCVVGYRTDEFPAFLWAKTNLRTRYKANNPDEIAAIVHCRDALGLTGAVLVANPPPKSLPEKDQNMVEQILREAEQMLCKDEDGTLSGSKVTPDLLKKISQATKGRSVEVNRELLIENSRLAAQIACKLCSSKVPP